MRYVYRRPSRIKTYRPFIQFATVPAVVAAVTQIRPINTGAHGILSGQNIIGPRGL